MAIPALSTKHLAPRPAPAARHLLFSAGVEIRSISAAAALRVVAIVFAVLIALRFLWIAHAIFIVTFLGVLLGLAVARAAGALERMRIPRGVGAPLVVLGGVALLVGLGALLAPSLRTQSQQLSSDLPRLVDQLERWLQQTPAKALVNGGMAGHSPPSSAPAESTGTTQHPKVPQGAADSQPSHGGESPDRSGTKPASKKSGGDAGLRAQLGEQFQGAFHFLFPIATSLAGAIAAIVLVLFIAIYIGASPGLYKKGILHLVPHRQRARGTEVLETVGVTLRQWLIARLIAMCVVGALTGAGLALLKVKGAAALGVLAGLMEFVPFFGPVISAVPALGVALLDSPQKALYVAILYLVMQQLEGNLITPLLLEKRLDIPPVLTIVAVAALGMVFGVPGMLIAEPLLAAVLVTTKMLYVTDVVGDEVSVGKE